MITEKYYQVLCQRLKDIETDQARLKSDSEAKICECEAKYQSIIDTMDVHVSLVDRNFKILWANDKAKAIFGIDMEGRQCCEVYNYSIEPCTESTPCLIRQAFSGGTVHEYETELITTNGKKLYFQGKIQVVAWDEKGRPKAVAKIYKDITEHKQAEEELKDSMLQLRQNLASTIQAMSRTVESRDPYTASHQRRTTEIACDIARLMGLDNQQVDIIRMAGAIHDLGKIAIPTAILSKPGKINQSEFSLIKQHPQTGFNILKGMNLGPVADIVLQHHERMDGSGYPYGLRGDEILLEARVIGVADVLEAMASHRPYRPALGIDQAFDELMNNRGLFYDANVVDAAVELFNDSGYKIH